MKKTAVAVVALAALFLVPVLAFAAGIPGATVTLSCTDTTICADPAVVVPPPATTDAEGAFLFENLAAAPWELEVAVPDAADPSLTVKAARLAFSVAADKAPARLTGHVTTLDGAEISLQVNAMLVAPGAAGIVLDPGYPKVQPAWNRNWTHANGRLAVRLAGTGLDGLEKVTLTSAKGSLETTRIFACPDKDEVIAIFPKRAAYLALVPDGTVRGTVVPITVALTNALGTDTFAASFRVVGSKKPPRH